jgi:glyoxylase-like metal-dependent hydrolase (beta-lactamase superfamily II)
MAVMTVRVEGSGACFSMLHSLERLGNLDVEVVYPGHGRPFRNMPEAVERSKQRLRGFLTDRKKIGTDVLKKIIIYTLLMAKNPDEGSFFDRLMRTHWFRETVDFYFDADYRSKYELVMRDFLLRGIVKSRNGRLHTTVKP